MNTSNVTQTTTQNIVLAFLVVALSACASTAPAPTLATGESLAIHQPVVKRMDSAVDSKATRAGKGVALGAVGAAGGFALGSSMGGLLGFACGPAAIICVPVGLAAGAGIGAVGGGVMGAGYAGRGGISGDKAARFNEIAAQLMDEANLASQVRHQLDASASQYWTLRQDSANTAMLKISSMRFQQLGDEYIQLAVNAQMEVVFDGRTETIKIEQVGARHDIDYWLDDEGENFRSEIDVALQTVAQTMVSRVAEQGRIARR